MSVNGQAHNSARVILAQANSINLHTGNVIEWFLLKKNRNKCAMFASPDELMDGLNCVMKTWMKEINDKPLQIEEALNDLTISNHNLIKKIDPAVRDELKISIKLFLSEINEEVIVEAVQKITDSLSVDKIDSILISLPSDHEEEDLKSSAKEMTKKTQFENIKIIWKKLEELMKTKRVTSLGVCDFDHLNLQKLYNWADIKPSVNQINLNSCCHVPNDLVQYATDHGIELLTHNDPPNILPTSAFQNLISERTEDVVDSNDWKLSFVARYVTLVKYRSIIHSKGYIVSANRSKSTQDEKHLAFL